MDLMTCLERANRLDRLAGPGQRVARLRAVARWTACRPTFPAAGASPSGCERSFP
ncbi:MAG TPA: hypothetical protein VHZ03_21975 [Trebonia sp.]|nr:hypothetical protein [Trebonia sp.]